MMKTTKYLVFLTYAAILLSLAACVPEFDHPLSDEKTSKVDRQLLGKWEEIDEQKTPNVKKNKKTYWIFSLREGTVNTIDYHEETVELNGDGKTQKKSEVEGPATVFTTTLDGKRYLSLGAEERDKNDNEKDVEKEVAEDRGQNKAADNEDEMSYLICRYEISDDALRIICPSQEFFGQAVATKKLPGKVEYTGKIKDSFDRVRITAKPEELKKYLQSNPDECYKNGIVLTFKLAVENKDTKAEPTK